MAPSATEITTQHASIILNRESLIKGFHAEDGVHSTEGLVKKTLTDRVKEIDIDSCEAGEEDAFFVADMGEVYRQHLRWKMHLKRVKPHYGEHELGQFRCAGFRLISFSCKMQPQP